MAAVHGRPPELDNIARLLIEVISPLVLCIANLATLLGGVDRSIAACGQHHGATRLLLYEALWPTPNQFGGQPPQRQKPFIISIFDAIFPTEGTVIIIEDPIIDCNLLTYPVDYIPLPCAVESTDTLIVDSLSVYTHDGSWEPYKSSTYIVEDPINKSCTVVANVVEVAIVPKAAAAGEVTVNGAPSHGSCEPSKSLPLYEEVIIKASAAPIAAPIIVDLDTEDILHSSYDDDEEDDDPRFLDPRYLAMLAELPAQEADGEKFMPFSPDPAAGEREPLLHVCALSSHRRTRRCTVG